MAKASFILPNKPAIKAGSILSYNYTDVSTFVPAPLTFNRNSAATRVNEKGLIEQVGYFGPELVQNGDFSQLGSELVTNGDFATDSDWNGSGGVITNGELVFASQDTSGTYQTISHQVGKTYKVSVEIKSVSNGSVRLDLAGGGASTQNFSTVGIHTGYVTPIQGGSFFIRTNAFQGSIDNVSVKEVDPNDEWGLGTGWSYGDGKVVFDGGSDSNLLSASNVVHGKSYKYSFTISDMDNGSLSFRLGSSSSNDLRVTSNGSYSGQAVSDGTSIVFRAESGFNGSVSNISVQEIQGDKPRIDYTDSLTEPSLLLEPQSTNLIPYSEDFSNAAWSKLNSIITPNQGISPNGGNNASKYVGSTTNQDLRINISVTSNYTYSIYIKAINSPFIRLRSLNGSCWFNMTTNTVATNNYFASAEIKSVGNDWYKLSVTSSSFTASNYFYIHPHATDNTTAELNGAEFLLWGAQLEQLPYTTSYIPTQGSTSTRLGETAVDAGNANVFNSEEGVLYAEISALANDGSFRMISLSDGSNNNRVRINYTSTNLQIQSRVTVGGVTVAEINKFGFLNITDFTKIALSYKQNEVSLYINGELIGTDTSATMPSANTFNVLNFDGSNGAFPFYGKTKNIQVFTESLSDEELQKLTTI